MQSNLLKIGNLFISFSDKERKPTMPGPLHKNTTCCPTTHVFVLSSSLILRASIEKDTIHRGTKTYINTNKNKKHYGKFRIQETQAEY